MWVMGGIIAELLSLHLLFPCSSEADEIYKIYSVIGSPTQKSLDEGLQLANSINYQFPQLPVSTFLCLFHLLATLLQISLVHSVPGTQTIGPQLPRHYNILLSVLLLCSSISTCKNCSY
ncbi:hypothetical protein MKX01_001200 [Papaver californicum]|nr:hypothetical protein MKX01_001200 [Papaver californicum]